MVMLLVSLPGVLPACSDKPIKPVALEQCQQENTCVDEDPYCSIGAGVRSHECYFHWPHCCATCLEWYDNITGCEFGDHARICRPAYHDPVQKYDHSLLCLIPDNLDTCCESCDWVTTAPDVTTVITSIVDDVTVKYTTESESLTEGHMTTIFGDTSGTTETPEEGDGPSKWNTEGWSCTDGWAIDGKNLKPILKNVNLDECKQSCIERKGCVSVEFRYYRDVSRCILSKWTTKQAGHRFRENSNFLTTCDRV